MSDTQHASSNASIEYSEFVHHCDLTIAGKGDTEPEDGILILAFRKDLAEGADWTEGMRAFVALAAFPRFRTEIPTSEVGGILTGAVVSFKGA